MSIDWLAFPALMMLLGAAAGIIGSLVGIGGGFLIVPVLMLFFDFSHTWAVATSLTAIFFNSLSASYNFHQQRRIDLKTAVPFALATLPGAFLGAMLTQKFSVKGFDAAFGLLLVLAALFMLFKPQGDPKDRSPKWFGGNVERNFTDAQGKIYTYGFSLNFGMFISFGVGFLSSIFGIGGGIVHVPLMILVLGVPAHIAVATSMFILTVSTSIGGATHFVNGNVQLLHALFISLGAILGAQIGSRLAPKLPARRLVQIFAFVMIIVALRLVFK